MMDGIRSLLGTPGPSGFGSKDTAETVSDGVALHGRTIIVTGATAGIGVETARVLALRGATVVIAARNVIKAEGVKADIIEQIPGAKVEVRELDVASFASVRRFADAWNAENRPLHVLINNAGVLNGKFQLSVDGHESTFATNHLGHFLLTELLIDNIIATAKESGIEGRVVVVSSLAHSYFRGDKIPYEELNDPKKFETWHNYGISKTANIQHANELSRLLKKRGANVTANSLHPGIIGTDIFLDYLGPALTRLSRGLFKPFFKSTEQGAATSVYVAVSPQLDGVTGKYFVDSNIAETHTKLSKDEKVAAELWEVSKRLTAA